MDDTNNDTPIQETATPEQNPDNGAVDTALIDSLTERPAQNSGEEDISALKARLAELEEAQRISRELTQKVASGEDLDNDTIKKFYVHSLGLTEADAEKAIAEAANQQETEPNVTQTPPKATNENTTLSDSELAERIRLMEHDNNRLQRETAKTMFENVLENVISDKAVAEYITYKSVDSSTKADTIRSQVRQALEAGIIRELGNRLKHRKLTETDPVNHVIESGEIREVGQNVLKEWLSGREDYLSVHRKLTAKTAGNQKPLPDGIPDRSKFASGPEGDVEYFKALKDSTKNYVQNQLRGGLPNANV